MIQNTTIIDKLNKKTENDEVLNTFIVKLLENEAEGKNYRKFYDIAINDALTQKGENKK